MILLKSLLLIRLLYATIVGNNIYIFKITDMLYAAIVVITCIQILYAAIVGNNMYTNMYMKSSY